MIYLDYNATTPIFESVKARMIDVLSVTGNPSSVHAGGRQARKVLDEARAQVAALAECRARDVIFTSGGTEANNLVINGAGAERLLISAVEHESVADAAKASGLSVERIPVLPGGMLDLAALEAMLGEDASNTLVSVMLVNNETGVIQPFQDVISLAKKAGAKVHGDAIQAAGKIVIAPLIKGADYICISAHKIGGPKGVGALIAGPTAPLKARQIGGGQELGRRSGTENIIGIAGLGVACTEALSGTVNPSSIKELRDYLEQQVADRFPLCIIAGADGERTDNISTIILPHIKGETQVMHFDLAGICVSSGSACSSGKVRGSGVLAAMGYDSELSACGLRVSLGWETCAEDIDAFLTAYAKIYERSRKADTAV